jgi:hypothetical protein
MECMAVAVAETTRICRKCKLELPIDQFGLDSHGRGGLNSRCKPCANEYKARVDRGDPSLEFERFERVVELAPDPTPAATLRIVLAFWRRRDVPFDEAWRRAVNTTVSRVAPVRSAPSERETWRTAFESTRETWRAAYEGRPALPGSLDRSILDD